MKQVAKSLRSLCLSVSILYLLFTATSVYAQKYSKTFTAKQLAITAEVADTTITTGDLVRITISVTYPQSVKVDFPKSFSQKDLILQGNRRTDAELTDEGMFKRSITFAYEPEMPGSIALVPLKIRVKAEGISRIEMVKLPVVTIASLLPEGVEPKPLELEPRTMSKTKAILLGILLSSVIIALTVWFTILKQPKIVEEKQKSIIQRLNESSDKDQLTTVFTSWLEQTFSIELASVPFNKYLDLLADRINDDQQKCITVIVDTLEQIQYSGKEQDLKNLKENMIDFTKTVAAGGEENDL